MSRMRELCRAAVRNAPNGSPAKAVAETLGMRYSTLLSQLSGHDGHKLGADLLVPLMRATGDREPLRHMAGALGGVFVEMPGTEERDTTVTLSLVESVRRFGDFAASVARSIDDGIISRDELDRIVSGGHRALEAIVHVVKRAENNMEAHRGKAASAQTTQKTEEKR